MVFPLFSADTPDVKRFAQVVLSLCSHGRASADVGRPNLLTWKDIYQVGFYTEKTDQRVAQNGRFLAHVVQLFLGMPYLSESDRGCPFDEYSNLPHNQ